MAFPVPCLVVVLCCVSEWFTLDQPFHQARCSDARCTEYAIYTTGKLAASVVLYCMLVQCVMYHTKCAVN